LPTTPSKPSTALIGSLSNQPSSQSPADCENSANRSRRPVSSSRPSRRARPAAFSIWGKAARKPSALAFGGVSRTKARNTSAMASSRAS
jgi:hypothetical protein